jgi:hypothetical protein
MPIERRASVTADGAMVIRVTLCFPVANSGLGDRTCGHAIE